MRSWIGRFAPLIMDPKRERLPRIDDRRSMIGHPPNQTPALLDL
jgi:hypothetical protein